MEKHATQENLPLVVTFDKTVQHIKDVIDNTGVFYSWKILKKFW